MNISVSKKHLCIAGTLFAVCLVLLISHFALFVEGRRVNGEALALVTALLVCGCYLKSARFELHTLLNGFWMIASLLILPYVMVYVVEYLAGQDASMLAQDIFWLNYFWCQVVYLTLFALTNHYRFSVISGSVFCYVVAAVNYFILQFRSNPLQLTDVLSVGTAADVAGNYVITLEYPLLYTGSIVFFAVCVATVAGFHTKRRQWYRVIYSLVLLGILLTTVSQFYQEDVWQKHGLTMNFWNPLQGYQENGTVLSLAMAGKYLRPEKPAHYSPSWAEEIVLQGVEANQLAMAQREVNEQNAPGVTTETPNATLQEKPNIIAIMNESYTDLSILGEFKTSVPYMSFYQSLQENTIRGNLSVSVLGGGTCNSEFEFLTGLTTAFLPSGVMAYQQYINHDLDSLATILRQQGYRAIAFHPGKPDSWQRNKVYPHLGFESFLTEQDMENPEYMREAYVTDSSDYREVIRLFEEKGDDKLFLFNVTIQNHGGYQLNTVDIPKWVSLRGNTERYPETEQYLSIMHASDEALRELITYFEQVDEPTMIVFFGDHQPSIEGAFVEKLLGQPLNTLNLELVQKRYKVPFFIWTNYEIPEAYYENLSANYLSTLALKTAGLQLPAYNQYLDQLQQQLPMINSLGYVDAMGGYHYFGDDTAEQALIDSYKVVQYNALFGGQGRLHQLYAVDGAQVEDGSK